MNRRPLHILCLDEGHTAGTRANEFEGSTALMVNPNASIDVLLDAATARTERIKDITALFLDLEEEDFNFTSKDACRYLTTVSAMAHETHRLLVAAQMRYCDDVAESLPVKKVKA